MRHSSILQLAAGLLLAATSAAQQLGDDQVEGLGPMAPQAERAPIELYLDFVVAIAGNEVITLTDLRSRLSTSEFKRRIEAGESFDKLQDEALIDLIETLMQIQAGKDRGFDPLFVDAITENSFEDRIERLGGHQEFSTYLRNFGVTAQEYKEQVKDSLYRRVWRESTTGQQRGPLGRFSVDRYIRPGLLESTYEAYASSRLERERMIVGAEPERFVVQAIVLDVQQHGGLGKCMMLARQLRDDVAGGEQGFEAMVRSWSVRKQNDGKFEAMSAATLRSMSRGWFGSDELYDFARTAQPGDVGQPLVRPDPHGIFIYRLVEQVPPTDPIPFEDVELQRRLRDSLLEDLDQKRVERAMRELEQVTHVWPADLRQFIARSR